jgi:citrate synthase
MVTVLSGGLIRNKVGERMADAVDKLIANALKIPVEAVVDSLAYQDVPEWDSMGHLDVVLSLEERLGESISDTMVPKLTSVRAIREFVGTRLDG